MIDTVAHFIAALYTVTWKRERAFHLICTDYLFFSGYIEYTSH